MLSRLRRNKLLLILIDILLRPLLVFLGFTKPTKSQFLLPVSGNYVGELRIQSLVLLHKYYLKKVGWHESKKYNLPIRDGNHIPWITYSALEFLLQLNLRELKVLEFGSGSSTIFFARNSKVVISFEENALYLEETSKAILGTNSKVLPIVPTLKDEIVEYELNEKHFEYFKRDLEILETEGNFYSKQRDFAKNVISNIMMNWDSPDLVFIDGGFRNLQMLIAASRTNNDLIVVLDNSEREEYKLGILELKASGFLEIPFEGLGPLNYYSWRTSFFVKSFNSLSKLLIEVK